MNPEWVRSLRDQCVTHAVAFHFKQWGNWVPSEEEANRRRVRVFKDPIGAPLHMVSVGKKQAGRTLDGREWDGLPWHV
jgi:protein gp37